MNSKFKKIFSFIGVFAVLAVVVFSSVCNFKNQTAFADTIYSNFSGSLVPINSAVYDNGTKLDAYSITKKAFNFTLVKEDNTNLINIKQYSSHISEIMTQGDNSTYTSWSDYGSFGFANLTQSSSDVYVIDTIPSFGTRNFSYNVDFVSNSETFSSFSYTFVSPLQSFLSYGSKQVYDNANQSWLNDAYRTLFFNSSISDPDFLAWLNRNAIKDTSSTTTISSFDSVNIEYGITSEYSINTYFSLSGSNTPQIAGSDKIFYCPVEISTKNLKDLNFVGINFTFFEDNSSTPHLFYLIFKYFDANGGYLQFKYETRSFGAYGNISDGVNLTYYFTNTGGDNYKTGFDAGYSQGLVDGDERSSQINYQNGYKDGSNVGYNKGYTAGVEASNNYTFLSLFSSVISAPFNAFKSLFNFDLLGVNIFNLLGALFTLAVVVTIVKKVI